MRQQAIRWAGESVDAAARAVVLQERSAPHLSTAAKQWLADRGEDDGMSELRDPKWLQRVPDSDAKIARELWDRATASATFQ